MYDTLYAYCATITQAAQDLISCKNRNNTMPQKRAIQTIGHYAKRLEYAVEALHSVPSASQHTYIQRQLRDALTPISGSVETLYEYHQQALNRCQIFHLEQIMKSCENLVEMLSQTDEQTS